MGISDIINLITQPYMKRKDLITKTDIAMKNLVDLIGPKYTILPQAAIDKYIHLETMYDGRQYSDKLLADILDMCERVKRYDGPSGQKKNYSNMYGSTSSRAGSANRYTKYTNNSKSNTNNFNPTKNIKLNATQKIISEYSYYRECQNVSDVKKKYHELSRKYHPDNPLTGNEEIFIAIDEQYNQLIERIS
ncbi:MAG: hypothetical protein KBT19_01290 [Lachnospiraceae bacterium]|nr:hypothetical protein [Candidatus Colinaster equi]